MQQKPRPTRQRGGDVFESDLTQCIDVNRPVVEPVPPVLDDELVLVADEVFEAREALIGTTGSLPAKTC